MQTTMQAVITDQDEMAFNHAQLKLAVFNKDGTPYRPGTPLSAEAVPNSEAKTIAALVADFNNLLASLRNAGILAEE